MPRSADYYDKVFSQPAEQSAGSSNYQSPLNPNFQSPQVTPGAEAPVLNAQGHMTPEYLQRSQAAAEKEANRSFGSFLGEGFREIFTGYQPNWNNMSTSEKIGSISKGTGKLAWNMIKAAPATIVKAPIGVGYSILEGADWVANKTIHKDFVPDKIVGTSVFGDNPVGRFFGDITGVVAPYKEAVAMAGPQANGWDKFLGALVATGKFSGDLAVSADLVNTIRAGFKPSLLKVDEGGGLGTDFRPKIETQLSSIKSKLLDNPTASKLGFSSPVKSFEQNPTASFFKLPDAAAAKYGGNAGNTFLRVAPAGNGMAEFSVVQVQKSLVGRLIDKFSKSQIIDTEMGPAVKMDSGLVKYDPSVITKAGDQLPAFLSPAPAAEVAAPAVASTKPNFNLAEKFAKLPPERTFTEFTKDIKNYQNTGISHVGDTQPVNASLARLEEFSQMPAIVQKTQTDVANAITSKEIPVNPDGTITVYRAGGIPGDGRLTSVGYTRDAVERFVQENLPDKNTPITEMKIRPDQVKVYIGGGEKELLIKSNDLGSALSPTEQAVIDPTLPEGYTRVADTAYKNTVQNGGVTIDLQGGQPSEGYAYSPYKDSETVVPKEQFGPEVVDAFIKKNMSRLQESGNHVGIWEDNGKIYLDVSQVGAPTPETLAAAEQAGQLAVFDLKNFETINTKLYGKETNRVDINPGQNPGANPAGSPPGNPEVPGFLTETGGVTDTTGGKSSKLLEQKAARQDAYNRMITGQEVPGVMQRPLKGFETKPVEPKQLAQISYIAGERQIDDRMINVISNALTGKDLSSLTQKEAYDVAETIRLFNQTPADLPGAGDMFWRPFTQPARYWMEAAERELKVPAYSRVYIPVETGSRLAGVLERNLKDAAREVYGKYADITKYGEEQRMITEYLQGNKAAIADNASLTPEVKADLIKIADSEMAFYKMVFEAKGIQSQRFLGEYAPHIRELGTIYNLYKTSDVPPEIRPFFEFERTGMDAPLEDHALVLHDIYARAFARDRFLREPLNEARAAVEQMPPNLKASANDYLQEKLGFQGEAEKTLNRWGTKISQATNGAIPADVFRRTINVLMNNSYAATLGLPRLMPIVSQFIQSAVMNWAEFGDNPRLFLDGFKKMFDKDAMAEFKNSGFSVEKGNIYGGDLATKAGEGMISKGVDMYQNVQDYTLKPFSAADQVGRAPAYFAIRQRFDENWQAFLQGKQTFDQFENNIKMSGLNPTAQRLVRENLLKNTPESIGAAKDLITQETIDMLFFPYRKGAESRAFYGLKGKMGLQYASFPFEFAHTLKSWIARGQWGNLLRWYSISTVIDRSFKEATGIDISRYLFMGPLANFPIGPLANAAVEFGKAVTASSQDLTEEADNHWKQVTDALKNYGGSLFGVGSERLQHFYESVNRMEKGLSVSTDPDPLKRFGIYSSTGKVKQWVTFSDLLKYTFGFTPTSFTEFSDNVNAIKKDTLRYNQKVDEAMNALVDGDYKKFDDLVTKNNLVITDINAKLKSYQVPLDQRLWERMPVNLKEKYINIFFPQ